MKTNVFFVSVTEHDLREHCSVFDRRLSEAFRRLRNLCHDISFNFNCTGERYKVVLPVERATVLRQQVLAIFSDCRLTVADERHFAGLT